MPDLKEIYSDRTKYPDTMEIDLGNGVKMPLKDWRDQMGPKAEFTQHTQRLSAEKQQVEQQLAEAQRQLADALQRQGAPRTAATGHVGKLDQYADDPILAPFVEEVKAMREQVQQLRQTAQQHEQQYWFGQHLNVIKDIQAKDEEYRDPQKVKALADFAASQGIPNLALAYQLQTRDRDLQKASKDAEAKGIEKGRQEAAIPRIPAGGLRPLAKPDKSIPQVFGKESEQAAQGDPEIAAALMGNG